jgi:hypothetical protein
VSEQTGGPIPPRDDEPGGESTPLDTQGSGPVGLEDRTRERGTGDDDTSAPASNQGKAEPMPPSPAHADPNAPLAPPTLGEMNVGAADPQAPRHPAAAGSGLSLGAGAAAPTDLGGPGTVPADERPVPSAGSSTGRGTGPEQPVSSTPGTSHRAPGLQGSTGADEAVETDVVSGASRMGPAGPGSRPTDDEPGDAQGVPVNAHDAARGTSEEHAQVQGARTPTADH